MNRPDIARQIPFCIRARIEISRFIRGYSLHCAFRFPFIGERYIRTHIPCEHFEDSLNHAIRMMEGEARELFWREAKEKWSEHFDCHDLEDIPPEPHVNNPENKLQLRRDPLDLERIWEERNELFIGWLRRLIENRLITPSCPTTSRDQQYEDQLVDNDEPSYYEIDIEGTTIEELDNVFDDIEHRMNEMGIHTEETT